MPTQDLYFMLNPFTGLIKIGVSHDVDTRRYNLECAAGVALTVMATVRCGEPYEQQLHMALHEDRQCGEWFLPSDTLLGLIENPEHIELFLAEERPKIKARLDAEAERKRQAQIERVAELAAERAALKAARAALKQKKEAARKKAEERKKQRDKAAAAEQAERLQAFHERQSDWLAQKGLRVPDAEKITAERLARIRRQRERNQQLLGVG